MINTAYLVGFWGHRKLIGMWKICRGEPWNLANWPVEFRKICRSKLWSLPMVQLATDATHTVSLSGSSSLSEDSSDVSGVLRTGSWTESLFLLTKHYHDAVN